MQIDNQFLKINTEHCFNSYVYALVDPRNGEIRYIGSSVRLMARYTDHIATKINKWIEELHYINLQPDLYVLEKCEQHELSDREFYWITKFKRLGANLTNINTKVPLRFLKEISEALGGQCINRDGSKGIFRCKNQHKEFRIFVWDLMKRGWWCPKCEKEIPSENLQMHRDKIIKTIYKVESNFHNRHT